LRHAVDVEPGRAAALKGKSEPVPAYRLLAAICLATLVAAPSRAAPAVA
jgi:hypothetical protein